MTDVEKARDVLDAAKQALLTAACYYTDQTRQKNADVEFEKDLEAYVQTRILESLQKQHLNHHVHGCECFCPDE